MEMNETATPFAYDIQEYDDADGRLAHRVVVTTGPWSNVTIEATDISRMIATLTAAQAVYTDMVLSETIDEILADDEPEPEEPCDHVAAGTDTVELPYGGARGHFVQVTCGRCGALIGEYDADAIEGW